MFRLEKTVNEKYNHPYNARQITSPGLSLCTLGSSKDC